MSENIKIVPFSPEYAKAFKAINQQWIEKYFKMEPSDFKALDHPQENIIDQGGYIAVALLGKEVVGVCALIKMDGNRFDYELAKMGVTPKAQGKRVGYLLGQHIIAKAKGLGAKNIFIESNRVLVPAIKLYEKLGFVEIEGPLSPYERADIQMECRF